MPKHSTLAEHMCRHDARRPTNVCIFLPNYGIRNFIWNAWAVHVLSNYFPFDSVRCTFPLHIRTIFYLEKKYDSLYAQCVRTIMYSLRSSVGFQLVMKIFHKESAHTHQVWRNRRGQTQTKGTRSEQIFFNWSGRTLFGISYGEGV